MYSIKEIVDALRIDIEKLAEEFGYQLSEIEDILNGNRVMSKIEILAFCKFVDISEKFMFKGIANSNKEQSIAYAIKKTRAKKAEDLKLEDFKNKIFEYGYNLSDEEVKLYYDPIKEVIKHDIIFADNPKLLIAIEKAYPEMKITGDFFNSEYEKAYHKSISFDKLRKNIYKLYENSKNKLYNSDIIYFAEISNNFLMLFTRGYFEWDNEKVLYLIKNGAMYETVVGTKRYYEDTRPVFGPDVAITLLIKDYCERQLK